MSTLLACFDIKKEYYMDAEEYNKIWSDISAMGSSFIHQTFWQEVEEAINTTIRELTVDLSPGVSHLVAVDDDKVHYAWTLASKFDGLKCCHHAKDMRRGFTVHTAAYPGSQIPIGAYFQREGESVQVTYLRMIRNIFGKYRGDTLPDLRRVTFASDRGYWMPQFLFQNLLEAGANVEGTVKRVSSLDFLYNKFCFCNLKCFCSSGRLVSAYFRLSSK